MAAKHLAMCTGRRKTAVARVRLFSGSGQYRLNGRNDSDYLKRPALEMIIRQPFDVIEANGQFDVRARLSGGGVAGQAEALRHGLSRALCDYDPKYRPPLKRAGFLTRDPRMVERKKYGQRGARARFQWCKR